MSTDSQASPNLQPETPEAQRPSASKRRRGRWAIWAAVVCMLFGAGYLLSQRTSSSGKGGGSKKGKGAGGAIPVSVQKVKQGDLGEYISALGTVTPVYTVTVTSRVAGQLMEVRYKEGQIVQKGELLAVIDPRPYQAVMVQAQGQLARDQAGLKNALIDLDRYRMVYAQKAIPEQTLATQQATVEQDQGVVKLDEGNLDAAKVNLDYTQITAPITGRVGLRQVDPGNIVQANGTQALLSITQLQPITVIFTMAEDYISDVTSQMRAGHPLRVDALNRDNQTELAQGTLLTVDNQIDVTTGTVRARANFANRNRELFPNEFVNAKLLVKTLRSVNLIPTSAIQRNNQTAFVYVVNANNTVQARNVQVATTDGDIAAVTGVRPDEALVTDGFDKLQDGTKVSIRRTGVAPTESPNAGTGEGPRPDGEMPKGSANTNINTGQQNPQSGNTKTPNPPNPPSSSARRGPANEPVAALYPPANCDVVVDARDSAGRNRGIQAVAGFGPARSGLPHHTSGHVLSGRKSGGDRVRYYGAA